MEELHGCYALFASMPIWSIALVLYLLSGFMIDICREYFEGFSYNVSHAARYGDVALIIIILIAAGIVQKGVEIPAWLNSFKLHFVLGILSAVVFIIMIIVEYKMRSFGIERQIADTYHNIVMVPILFYLIIASMQLVASSGSDTERITSILLFFIWFSLSYYDKKTGRLEQRRWLKQKRFDCILKN